jgi:hypothetical protein
MKKNLIAIATIFITLVACNTSNKINTDEATTLITEYLEENPLYETGKFNTNKQKLVTNKDKEFIESIQRLSDEGLIAINNEKTRKKWFSKDSVYVISPTLTEEALPYLVKQNKNSAQVKTIIYKLNNKKITLEKSTEKMATCVVVLDKEKTPFYSFGKDPYPNSNFITQKFKLKYNEKSGWKIIKK